MLPGPSARIILTEPAVLLQICPSTSDYTTQQPATRSLLYSMAFSLHRSISIIGLAFLAACTDPKSSSSDISLPRNAADSVHDTLAAPTASSQEDKLVSDTAYVHDVAAFLAGLSPSRSSGLYDLSTLPAWQSFAADANKSWTNYHQARTMVIQNWAASELDSVRQNSPTVFYPFSGPDFLNAFTMFPTSQTYVLVGLEPVGSVPQRSTLEKPELYPAVKASLWSVLSFSFFRTNDMAVDLKSVELDGALPLIMLFAARTDNQIISIRHVQLGRDAQLVPADTMVQAKPNLKIVPGAEVVLRAKDGQEKKVYYFSADLNDWQLNASKEAILRYVESLGPLTTYVKAATYLMHKPYFSKVRNLILERSPYVLQDDSGIAMKYFRPADWKFTYYGVYRRPINLFAKHYQPELTASYNDSLQRPSPLPFGTGYNWRQKDSNLLLAQRRKAPAL